MTTLLEGFLGLVTSQVGVAFPDAHHPDGRGERGHKTAAPTPRRPGGPYATPRVLVGNIAGTVSLGGCSSGAALGGPLPPAVEFVLPLVPGVGAAGGVRVRTALQLGVELLAELLAANASRALECVPVLLRLARKILPVAGFNRLAPHAPHATAAVRSS